MPASADWYRTLFSGLFIEAQRRMPAQTPEEADFILHTLQPPVGGRLLDVPCGNGRLTLEIARRGYACTGVDLSRELLDDGRDAAMGLPVWFEQRDMRDLPWPGKVHGAFCFGNSFGYFDDSGNRDFLKAVFQSLEPGGRFALMTGFCAEGFFQQRLQRAWFPMDDLLFLLDTSYDPATACCTSSYTLIKDGKIERHQALYRIYTYRELMSLFADVGFRDVQTFGSLKHEPYTIGSPALYVVARRP